MTEFLPPRPLILFRFHKQFDVCLQNVWLLRKLNPAAALYGMYGGFGGAAAIPRELTEAMDGVYALPYEDPYYNWKNGDLCVRWWHKEIGHRLDFTHLCVAEWDMLYLKPMVDVFSGLAPDTNYVALSGSYTKLLAEGWPWIQGNCKGQVEALLRKLKEEERAIVIEDLSFGIFGGCVLCRKFLDLYAQKSIPSYSNDEVRLALYADLFGIPMVDSGFLHDKRNKTNADGDGGDVYGAAEVDEVIARGGNIIHPVRSLIEGLEKKLRL